MYWKKSVAIGFLSWMALLPVAQARPVLDKVMFSVSAKEWVQTDKARLHVTVNGTLKEASLVEARADIMKKLQTISTGEWHITQWNRLEDNSGLNKLTVEALITAPSSALHAVYEKAKAASQPGMVYTISGIDFNPDEQDIERAQALLRTRLYEMVNAELTRLNAAFPKQQYSVNRLYFVSPEQSIMPAAIKKQEMTLTLARAQAPLAVSSESSLKVVVEFASNRFIGDEHANSQ